MMIKNTLLECQPWVLTLESTLCMMVTCPLCPVHIIVLTYRCWHAVSYNFFALFYVTEVLLVYSQ